MAAYRRVHDCHLQTDCPETGISYGPTFICGWLGGIEKKKKKKKGKKRKIKRKAKQIQKEKKIDKEIKEKK